MIAENEIRALQPDLKYETLGYLFALCRHHMEAQACPSHACMVELPAADQSLAGTEITCRGQRLSANSTSW